MAHPSWLQRISFGALCAIAVGATWAQITDLGGLNGGSSSQAFGVNADGTVVVGQAADGAAGNATRAIESVQSRGAL